MKYRAWREYRDGIPALVLLWNGDVYPALTRAVERALPDAIREGMRPADRVRSHRDTSWCMARGTDAFLVYSMNGDAVDLDLTDAPGSYAVSWLDSDWRPAAEVRSGHRRRRPGDHQPASRRHR